MWWWALPAERLELGTGRGLLLFLALFFVDLKDFQCSVDIVRRNRRDVMILTVRSFDRE